jgi:hypothetical protein
MHQEHPVHSTSETTSNPSSEMVVVRREELRGEVVFASEEEQTQRSTELLGEGALLVTVPAPNAAARGRLGELVEELVERELARMGAPSPYLAAWSAMPEDAQARLADQLFRVRTVGATGLAIALGSLRAIAAPTLSTDDSATLRWLAETTEVAPLVLLVDDGDLLVPAWAAPIPLGSLLATRRPAWEPTPSSSSSSPIDVESDIDWADSEPRILTGDDATMNETLVSVASIDAVEAIVGTDADEEIPCDVATAEPAVVEEIAVEAAPVPEVASAPVVTATPEPEVTVADEKELPQVVVETVMAPRGRRGATIGVPRSGPSDAWRSWAIALGAARGAQPLAAFERLFAESYVPLANAIAAGLDDPRAVRAYDEFRQSFERSYTDAFIAFGATNRRPRLVMDAYDIASKQARLSNARTSHVLIVDSMRFDLGCLVRDALAREASGVATLTAETILWSALPTTTMRQIETFARGLDALRAPAREEPSESLRGRAAEVVRRLRVGSRELYKLDVVPSMLEGTSDVIGALDNIANATAEAIARHVSTLPPRTLLFVVGDHGFSIDRRGELRTGGASPEEVLVPAFSWLVGDLH